MPHATVEYTDNIADRADIPALLRMMADKFCSADGVFPVGGVRVRALRLSEYAIAGGAEAYAFMHISVKIGAGRTEDVRKAFFAGLFDDIKHHLKPLLDEGLLALSMYVDEVDETESYRQNGIHKRLSARNDAAARSDHKA